MFESETYEERCWKAEAENARLREELAAARGADDSKRHCRYGASAEAGTARAGRKESTMKHSNVEVSGLAPLAAEGQLDCRVGQHFGKDEGTL